MIPRVDVYDAVTARARAMVVKCAETALSKSEAAYPDLREELVAQLGANPVLLGHLLDAFTHAELAGISMTVDSLGTATAAISWLELSLQSMAEHYCSDPAAIVERAYTALTRKVLYG